MRSKLLIAVAMAVPAGAALGGCTSGDSAADRAERVSEVVDACRGHGGVVAFDDDAVICRDNSSPEPRGASAVAACRDHGGVTAFDDDIVICRDQTVQEAEGG